MNSKHTPISKALLAVIPALLCALALCPVKAQALVTYYYYFQIADGPYKNHATVKPTSGSGDDTSCQSIRMGAVSAPTVTCDEGYHVDYWTASSSVYYPNFEMNMATEVASGNKISLWNCYVPSSANTTLYATIAINTYDVKYLCGDNVATVSLDSETVNHGNCPTGSTVTCKVGYEFDYWTANVNVTLNDGTSISAADPITDEQLKKVEVTKGITFTAHAKQQVRTATYTSAGNGTVSGSERVTLNTIGFLANIEIAAGTPLGVTPVPAKDYTFDYWSPSEEVYSYNSEGTPVVFTPIDTTTTKLESLSDCYITQDTTFTAHFRKAVANVTYETDGNGTVDPTSDRIDLSESTTLEDAAYVGAVDVDSITLSPNPGFQLAYWTANKPIYYKLDENTWVEIGVNTPVDDLTGIYVADDTTFTANLERYAYAITYKTAGGGTVSRETELVELGDYPVGCTITPNKGYEFDYWTANVALEIDDGNNTDPQVEGATTIKAGDPITDEQLKLALLNDDVILTAHFKQTAVDPEPEPVNPDGGDTIKPADTGKLTPKTGDTLPGATAAVALGAGVAVAGAALLKKRHQ